MNIFKRLVKGSTSLVKETVKQTVQGIDEGINGDDIKEVRDERKALRDAERKESNRKNKIISLAWTIAAILFIGMILYVIYTSGFNNNIFSQFIDTYGIACIVPFLLASIVSLCRRWI